MAKDTKKQLLDFIDHKAFDVILKASDSKLDDKQKEELKRLQDKTEKEKEKFHGYSSAEEIKKNFLANVRSKPAQKLDKELKKFDLPTLPDLKEDFTALCDKLNV